MRDHEEPRRKRRAHTSIAADGNPFAPRCAETHQILAGALSSPGLNAAYCAFGSATSTREARSAFNRNHACAGSVRQSCPNTP
jgi:hypothetical protein